MPEKQKLSVFTTLALVSVVLSVSAVLFGIGSHRGIDGPGGMMDLSFIAAPVTGIILGGPGAIILSIIAIVRKEPHASLTLIILIPAGLIVLGVLCLVYS